MAGETAIPLDDGQYRPCTPVRTGLTDRFTQRLKQQGTILSNVALPDHTVFGAYILYCRTKVLIRLLALSDASDCINSFVRQYTIPSVGRAVPPCRVHRKRCQPTARTRLRGRE